MASVFTVFLVTGAALPALPLHINDQLGFGPFMIGLVSGAQFAASLISRFWSGTVSDRRGPKHAVTAGLIMAALAGLFYLLSLFFTGNWESGSSRRAAAERFSVSASSVIRWVARAADEGSPKPRKQGHTAGKGPLAEHLNYLIAAVEAEPDITMPELAGRLHAERGITAAWASLSKLLCRAGFTYKKTADGVGMRTR